jgi:hypothetical protein
MGWFRQIAAVVPKPARHNTALVGAVIPDLDDDPF